MTKLVDSNAPPHVNVISRLHVSPESRMTAHDQVVPYSAIVGDVRVRQEKIFGTDRGGIAVLGRRMSRDHEIHGHRHHRQHRPVRWMQPQGMHHQRQAMQPVPVKLLANRQR